MTHSNERNSTLAPKRADLAEPFVITQRNPDIWQKLADQLTPGQTQALKEAIFQQNNLFHHEIHGSEQFIKILAPSTSHSPTKSAPSKGCLFIFNHDTYTMSVIGFIANIIEKTQRPQDIVIITADAILAAKLTIANITLLDVGSWYRKYGCTAPAFHEFKALLKSGKIVILFPGGEQEWVCNPDYKKQLNPNYPGIPQVSWCSSETDRLYNQAKHAHRDPRGIWPGNHGDRFGFIAAIVELAAQDNIHIPIFPVTSPNAEDLFKYNAFGDTITRWLAKRKIFFPVCEGRWPMFNQIPHIVPKKNIIVITKIGVPINFNEKNIPKRVTEEICFYYSNPEVKATLKLNKG